MAIWTRRFLLLLLLLLCSWPLLLCSAPFLLAADQTPAPSAPREYTFGSLPFLPQPTLEGLFSPLAAEISTALGRPIHYASAPSFEKFMTTLEQQQYDIAHIQPFDYVTIAAKAGYLPLACRTELLPAVFVVKTESPLKDGRDLRGKTLALPPKVTAVSHMALVALRQAGLKPGKDVTLRYFNSHHECLQHVLIGDVDAGAAGRPTLRIFEAESQRALRVILTSPEITPTLIVVHKRVPPAEREIIKNTVIATRFSGAEPSLRKIFVADPEKCGGYFRSATDRDFDEVHRYLKLLGE